MSDPKSTLDELMGPPVIQVNGVSVLRTGSTVEARRPNLNFLLASGAATDNPTNDSVDVPVGSGAAVIGTRIAPDANDQIVWAMQESGTPFLNTGSGYASSSLVKLTGSNAPVAQAGGLVLPYSVGLQGANSPTLSTAQVGSTDTTTLYTQSTHLSVSCWVKIFGPNPGGSNLLQFIAKHYQALNTWSSPFLSFELGLAGNLSPGAGSAGWLKADVTTVAPSAHSVAVACVGFGTWHHIGFTYDAASGTLRLYADGTNVATSTSADTTALDMQGSGGPVVVGANTANGTVNPDCLIHDIRISNTVVRPASYFRQLYRTALGLPYPP